MSNANPSTASNRLNSPAVAIEERESGGTQKLQEKARELGQNLQELGSAAREAAQEQIGNIRENAAGYVEQKCAKCQEMEQSLESRIRTQPVKSTLIACGIGFVLGLFFRRR